jgi:hypothetical protein
MNATQSLVEITGNTYPVKDALKAIGARWNADKKCWMIAAEKADKAAAIVGTAPKKAARSFAQPFAARSAWAQRSNGGVGFCGAPRCGRSGCKDCRD